MESTKGFKTKEGDGWTHVLKILKNIYRQNQAGQICNQHLNDGLQLIGFKQPAVNECVWYIDKNILFYYIDGGIFMGTELRSISKAIEEIENEVLEIEDKGNIEDYLGARQWKDKTNPDTDN